WRGSRSGKIITVSSVAGTTRTSMAGMLIMEREGRYRSLHAVSGAGSRAVRPVRDRRGLRQGGRIPHDRLGRRCDWSRDPDRCGLRLGGGVRGVVELRNLDRMNVDDR